MAALTGCGIMETGGNAIPDRDIPMTDIPADDRTDGIMDKGSGTMMDRDAVGTDDGMAGDAVEIPWTEVLNDSVTESGFFVRTTTGLDISVDDWAATKGNVYIGDYDSEYGIITAELTSVPVVFLASDQVTRREKLGIQGFEEFTLDGCDGWGMKYGSASVTELYIMDSDYVNCLRISCTRDCTVSELVAWLEENVEVRADN